MAIAGLFLDNADLLCQTQFQKADTANAHIAELRLQLKSQETRGARHEALATLWILLADDYEGQADYDSAEDAFAHAVRLLTDSPDTVLYVNALDGLGEIYSAKRQLELAEKYLRKAFELVQSQNNPATEASVRKDLAVTLLSRHKFSDAAKQASEALRIFQSEPDPDITEEMTAYLTRSQSLFGLRQYGEAARDMQQAKACIRDRVAENSLEMLALRSIEGAHQIRSGAVEQGELTFRETLDLLSARMDLTPGIKADALLRIMQNYSQSLRLAHQKREAQKVEEETARSKEEQSRCPGCTVSVAALGLSASR